MRFLEFPSVKLLKIWQRSYSLLAFLAFNLSEKFVRPWIIEETGLETC